MLSTVKNALKIPDLKKKIIFTLMMLLIFRIGSYIPVPGIDANFIRNIIEQGGGILGFFDIVSGGAFSNFTIFAMSITPYINASIIMQLLTVAIPKLEQLAKEGEEGRKKLAKYTRYLTVVLAFVQSIGITYSLRGGMLEKSVLNYLLVALTLTAGTAFLMWLGEQINDKGIGNGISILIFTGIVARIPVSTLRLVEYIRIGTLNLWQIALFIVGAVVIIALVIYISEGQRRIPVQYAKRVVGRKMYGGQSTHIPLKVNQSGVLPIIFAMSIMALPQTIANFWRETAFSEWFNKYLGYQSPWYAVIYALLIIFFTYFYTQIQFNPIEIAKNMKQYGGFIPGIRPGKPTSQYLFRISNRITLAGAIFLALIAILPIFVSNVLKLPLHFGGTALLILVGVALDTMKQIESQMIMRHYKGFLK